MSYDLMVFEPTVAPRERQAFMEWYDSETEWSEAHSYNDPKKTSELLQKWFAEIIQDFPPMNGPLATDDLENPKVSDYSIGHNIIYCCFSWSCAEEAFEKTKDLAIKHKVGFFNVSAGNGEIIFP